MLSKLLAQRLPRATVGAEVAPTDLLPKVGLSAFSDDLIDRDGQRLQVRLVIRDRPGGGYIFDFTDSTAGNDSRFGLSTEQAQLAAELGLAHALEQSVQRVAGALTLQWEPSSWIGAGPVDDPRATAFGMARVYDVVLGALARPWPQRVGAGSCSLGAIVELSAGEHEQFEILPGGEGATAVRPGRDLWDGPILAPHWMEETEELSWVSLDRELRVESGGGGARVGGCGVVRTYRARAPIVARVATDRTRNPPHGVDGAGPPKSTSVWVVRDEQRHDATPWQPIELSPGDQLVVETCGGAGHGFPGYGDIQFDPGDWFGDKKTS